MLNPAYLPLTAFIERKAIERVSIGSGTSAKSRLRLQQAIVGAPLPQDPPGANSGVSGANCYDVVFAVHKIS
jgi:hypothetical protein